MIMIMGRGVNANFHESIRQIRMIGKEQSSRAGDVMVAPHPVMTITTQPRHRVLLCPTRDANPFFHIYEALWMLAGSNDAKLLDRFVRDFSSRFSGDDGIQHAAYGYRWRKLWHFDQLEETVSRLRKDHLDRRVVITMWDPVADYQTAADNPAAQRDVPCNTQIYLRIVDEHLDMTVTCRSNDIIWGAMGSNIVHFSVLQEWLAAMIGVGVGRLYQLSNNWHAYREVLDRQASTQHWSDADFMRTTELCTPDTATAFLSDCEDLLHVSGREIREHFRTEWFRRTLVPMMQAHNFYREGDMTSARQRALQVDAPDWSRAAVEWLERRTSE